MGSPDRQYSTTRSFRTARELVRSLGGGSSPSFWVEVVGERPRVPALKGSSILFLLPLLYGKTVSVKYFETLIKE